MAILVIDDDETCRVLVVAALEQLGIEEVLVADDGLRGLQCYDRMAVKPEAIICDIFMPNMDGIEILTALETRGYQGGIVLVSGADLEMLLGVVTGRTRNRLVFAETRVIENISPEIDRSGRSFDGIRRIRRCRWQFKGRPSYQI